MRNVYSNSPPEPTRLPDSSEQMLDFNNLFQESVSKMMRVTDDLHQMVLLQSSNIRDLQNMMIGLLTIIGISIFLVLALLSIIGYLIFFIHKSRKCLNITKAPSEPKSIQCCENTFKSSWKLFQHLKEKHNLNLYRDESTTDDCQEGRGPQTLSPFPSESVKSEQKSREMLCNENSPILYDSTDAHEMSKDYCIGEIVDEEKQTYDKKPISPTTPTSTTSGGFNGSNKNTATMNVVSLNKANNNKIGTTKQTISYQHTTNFIVCFLDSLKPLNV